MGKEKLPEGWKILPIGKCIADDLSGFACSQSNLVEEGGYVQLRPFNIENGKLNLDTLYQIPLDIVDESKYYLEKGDILFNNTNSTELVGKSAIANERYKFAFSNHINRIRLNINIVVPQFFHNYLIYMWTKGHFAKHCKKWIGQSGYTLTTLKKQPILVPPLDVQQEIVAKIDKQMLEIRRFKAETDASIETSQDLFKSYIKEVFEEKIINQYPKIKLKKLTSKIGSGSTPRGGKSVYQDEGVPFIRSMNVHLNTFKKDGLARISTEIDESMKNTRVQKDDVLLNITGASIGRVCVVPEEICPANVNQHVSIIRTNTDLVPQYLSYYISNPNFQKFIMDSESGATRQALTKTKIENFDIPLPPFEIQQQIVEQLNKINGLSQIMINQINSQLEAIDQLPASIINEVFGKYEIPERI